MDATAYNTFVNDLMLLGADTARRNADLELTSVATIEAAHPVVLFEAGKMVQLLPGFHAKSGSDFIARFNYCKNPATGQHNPLTEGGASARSLVSNETGLSEHIRLQVFPNPVQQRAAIQLTLPQSHRIHLALFNQNGQRLRQYLTADALEKGQHFYQLDASSLSTGIYFLRLQSEQEVINKKLVIQH